MDYDTNNVFAKILRGEIIPQVIYEDTHVLVFHDVRPQRRVHALIIPKGAYANASQFGEQASDVEIVALIRAIPKIAEMLGLQDGYRLISNCGADGGQEVPHLHWHLVGGEAMGPMLS